MSSGHPRTDHPQGASSLERGCPSSLLHALRRMEQYDYEAAQAILQWQREHDEWATLRAVRKAVARYGGSVHNVMMLTSGRACLLRWDKSLRAKPWRDKFVSIHSAPVCINTRHRPLIHALAIWRYLNPEPVTFIAELNKRYGNTPRRKTRSAIQRTEGPSRPTTAGQS